MLNQAEEILKTLGAQGFDQGEVAISQSRMTEMQIDAGEVSLLRTTANVSLHLRGIQGGRYASLTLNQLDKDSLGIALAQLTEAARSAPVDEARQLADSKAPLCFERGPDSPDLESMYGGISEFEKMVASQFPDIKLEQAGVSHRETQVWVLNNRGLNIQGRRGGYNFGAMFSGKRGDKTSSFNFGGGESNSLDRKLIDWGGVRPALESSVKEIDHGPLGDKFSAPVLLTPEVVEDFLGAWLGHLDNGHLISGTSLLRDKMNQKVTSDCLTVKVSPQDPELASHEFFTSDGYASLPSTLVEQGTLKSWMLSDFGARKTGLTRALNDGKNLVIAPGQKSREELVAGIARGLWLGRFSGGYPAANGDFSGVAKNSFLIENGKVTRPLSEVMVAGNVFDMFNRILGVSRERLNNGVTLTPWMAVDGLTIAG